MTLPIPTLPSADSKIYVTTNSGDSFNLPNTFELSGVSLTRNVSSAETLLRDGAIRTRPPRWEPTDFSLDGWIIDGAEGITLDDLSDLVYDSPWRIRPNGNGGRYIEAEVEPFTFTRRGENSYQVSLSFTALKPFFYGNSLLVSNQTYNSSLGTGASEFVDNPGSVFVKPVITITGGSGGITNPTVTNNLTGQTVAFFGLVGLNSDLVIDCDKITATVDGANALNSMNGSFFYSPIELFRDVNNFSLGGSGIMTVQIAFRPAWLVND